MEEKKRETGIDLISAVPWGTHFCLFYQTKQDLIDILLPYFKAGLENNEFCIWVTSEPLDEIEVREAIGRALPHFDRYLERGQIEIVPYTGWYLKHGSFNLQRVLNAWIDKLNQALLKGFDGLRTAGNITWLEKGNWRNFIDYEEATQKTIGQYQMIALCAYSLDNCGASELIDVFSKHQSGFIRRNGKYELIESSEGKRERKAEGRIEEHSNELEKRNEQFREESRKTKEAEGKTRQYAKELRMVNLRLKAETKRAQEADRLKSQFLANMSHEIRTPLTVIDGAVHLLQKDSLSLKQRDLLVMMRDSDKKLLQLINAILDWARIEAGQTKVVKKEFLLKETMKNIISGFEFEARKKDLEIRMICPRHLPSKISTDEGKLTQILSNLISNALKFTQKGRVEVRLSEESNSTIRFSIEDTGIGIPEEKLPLIFSKFYQMNGATGRGRGSVGLGLPIVKELVDLLGGKMEVKSKLGKGSLFCFSLPCVSSKERVVPDRDGSGTPSKTEERVKKGVNILIAEDDSSTYDIIRRFLEGCTTSRAVDGEDVLKKIKEKSYDMVLMDIRMPKMDGLEATRRIREKDSDLPIIAVTARTFKADEDKCLAAGCNDYIAKPIAPQKLIAKINQYAVRRLSRRQNSPPK